MGAPRHRRHRWRREIDESKIDMGLLAPLSQEALDLSLYSAVLDNDHAALGAMKGQPVDIDMRVSGKLGEPEGTLLHFAVRHGTLKTLIGLLQLGADPQAQDAEGATPREVARQKPTGGRMGTVLELWEKRRKLEARSAGGPAANPAAGEDQHGADKKRA
jgi:hypothetical protein